MSLAYILKKYDIGIQQKSPIEIPGIGRNDLATLFAELGYTTGAEVGVEKGVYSAILCSANPKLHLYCIDSWKWYEGYKENNTLMDCNFTDAKKRLERFNCTFLRQFSLEAIKSFQDGSLDFVYLDANHDLVHVLDDIYHWTRKVRIGGIIAGHDYRYVVFRDKDGKKIKNLTHHVVEAVQAYTHAYEIHPWFVLGRKERRAGETRDRARSWMFVKTAENHTR